MITQNDIIAVLIEDPKYVKSNIRLQKTLFLIFGQLIKNNETIVLDTFKFQRWKYGPVNVELYKVWNKSESKPNVMRNSYTISDKITDIEKELINAYKDFYDKYPVYKLVDYTNTFNSCKNKKDFENMDINEIIDDFRKEG